MKKTQKKYRATIQKLVVHSKRQKCFESDSDREVDIVVKKEILFSAETMERHSCHMCL